MVRSTCRVTAAGSGFAGFRFPPEVITLAVRWYLRFGLRLLPGRRGAARRPRHQADHVTVYRWVRRFTPLLVEAARPCRHTPGDRWFVDETHVKVSGRWRYLYRALDQFGQVIEVLLTAKRDQMAARRFFTRALGGATEPAEVTTDRAPGLPAGARRATARRPACHRAVREQPGRGRPRPAQSAAATHARTSNGTARRRSSPPGTPSCRTCGAATTNSGPTLLHATGWRSRSPNSRLPSDRPDASAVSACPTPAQRNSAVPRPDPSLRSKIDDHSATIRAAGEEVRERAPEPRPPAPKNSQKGCDENALIWLSEPVDKPLSWENCLSVGVQPAHMNATAAA